MDKDLEAFLDQAGRGCISGHINEWPQLKPACKYAYDTIQRLRSSNVRLARYNDALVKCITADG